MPPQIDKIEPFDQNENIERSLSDENPDITRTQNCLFVLLFIQWVVFFVTFDVGIYSVLSGNVGDISSGMQSLIPILVLLIYYSFGLLVTYKKYRIGLIIFAVIGIILFVAICILVGYILLSIITLGVGFGNLPQAYKATAFVGILFTVVVVIAVLSLKFSFDLAKLLKTKEYFAA